MTAQTGIADLILEVNDESLFYRQGIDVKFSNNGHLVQGI